MIMNLDEIKNLDAARAIEVLTAHINSFPEDDEALTERGLKYWSQGQRREAINDYLAALKINPQSRAKMALEFVNSILDYYNKDLYNP